MFIFFIFITYIIDVKLQSDCTVSVSRVKIFHCLMNLTVTKMQMIVSADMFI